jgi:hypothetical protein
MIESDLKRIEAALGHPLPQAFRNVMLNFPQALIDAATMTDPDGNEFVDCMLISNNPDSIIAGIVGQQSDWPSNLIWVGENGCGEEYSVDISQESCPVYESGPHNDAGANGPAEDGYFEQVSADLEGWVKHLVNQAK